MSGTVIERLGSGFEAIEVIDGDLDDRTFDSALRAEVIAWDTETTGLDWRSEKIATVQLQIGALAYVVRINGRVPHRLKAVLEDAGVLKVMHHAMFDLRFLVGRWAAEPTRVACTKIASKLAHPDDSPEDHSLASLVRRYFDVEMDKGQRLSDWTAPKLNPAQVQYAADDVRYLWPLYEELDKEIRSKGLVGLRERCYSHLRTRVELDLRGYPDVFDY